LVDGVNDLSGLGVTVRFDHGEGALGGSLEFLLGEEVSIITELELT